MSIGVGVVVRELVNIIFSVKVKGKGYNIIFFVVWIFVVIYMFCRYFCFILNDKRIREG